MDTLRAFSILQDVLEGVTALALVASLGFLAGAVFAWRTQKRKQRLFCFASLLAVCFGSVATHQALLHWVLLPSLARQAEDAHREFLEKGLLVKTSDAAPSFSVRLDDRTMVHLDQLQGNVVLLNFFATWCGPCLMELPYVEELWDEYRDRDDFSLIVVGREETDESVAAFKAEHGYSFPIAADPERKAYALYAEEFIPRTFVISREGKIVYQSTGFDVQEFAILRKVLADQLR